jgi:hypothetical protein
MILTTLFVLALIWLVWKIVVLGLKLTWGIARILCSVLFLPALLLVLVYVGLMYVAVPVLVIVGILVLIKLARS